MTMQVRVVKDRHSGQSKGFGFVDFESVEAAQAMVEAARKKELKLGDRLLMFHYSKPLPERHAGGGGGGAGGGGGEGEGDKQRLLDWVCPSCNVTNFARRTECFKVSGGLLFMNSIRMLSSLPSPYALTAAYAHALGLLQRHAHQPTALATEHCMLTVCLCTGSASALDLPLHWICLCTVPHL